MRKIMVFAAAVCFGGAASAQTTTNCNSYGSTVRCTTSPDAAWQNQQNLNQAASNLGAAIAARRDRKRQERAVAEAAAAQAATEAAIRVADAADIATQLPLPTDEQPILLACTMNGGAVSLALFERHNRVDVTVGSKTKTRPANFSTAAVTWVTPLLRFSLNRLDGSYTGDGNIPEVQGQSISGSCALATERKF